MPRLNKLQYTSSVKEIKCEVVSVHFFLACAGNKDPEADLKCIIPMRLFGDGAEAHSNLKNEKPK